MEPMTIHFWNILLGIGCICQAKVHSQDRYKEDTKKVKVLEGIHKTTKIPH